MSKNNENKNSKLKNVTGMWKNKGKNFYRSPVINEIAKEKLKEALDSGKDFVFYLFQNDKNGNEKAPDVNLVIGDFIKKED